GTSGPRDRRVWKASRPLGPGRSASRTRPERRRAARGERRRFSGRTSARARARVMFDHSKADTRTRQGGNADAVRLWGLRAVGGLGPRRPRRAYGLRSNRPARATSPSPSRVMRTRLVVRLEETRGALTAAHAHRDDAVARLAPEHLVGERADHAR